MRAQSVEPHARSRKNGHFWCPSKILSTFSNKTKYLISEIEGDNACGYSSSEEEVSLAWGNDASLKNINQYAYQESHSEDDHFYYDDD